MGQVELKQVCGVDSVGVGVCVCGVIYYGNTCFQGRKCQSRWGLLSLLLLLLVGVGGVGTGVGGVVTGVGGVGTGVYGCRWCGNRCMWV